MNNNHGTDHTKTTFSKVLLCIMMPLFMCQQISAITKTVYVDGGSDTDHYATLSAALTAIHKLEAPRNIRIELSINITNEQPLGFGQAGDNITIVATGTRHAVTFKSGATRMMYVSAGAKLTLGGADSKTLIFRADDPGRDGYTIENKTLIKVKDGTLNIKDNVELAYGNAVLWLDTDNPTDPAPVVNMSGGVIHSGKNWCVNITTGIFNMSGGYICGRYKTGGDKVPAAIGPDKDNRLLNIANTEAAFTGKNVLAPGDIYNYLYDFYGSNYTCGGVVVYSETSQFNMSGGSISGIFTNVSAPENSVITGYSGDKLSLVTGIKRVPVYVNQGSFNFSGGSIHTNYTRTDGGAVNMSYYEYDVTSTEEKYENATTTMSGNALIAYCECYPNGGAARVEKATTFDMKGGKITMCTCGRSGTGGGGAVRVVAAKFKMSGNAEISNCYSPGNGENYSGGAIGAVVSSTYGKIPTVLELNGGKIHHNESNTYGGGISATDKGTDGKQKINVSINGTEIYENTAQNNSGGGIYIGGRSNVTIDGGTKIHDNTAKEYGGGIYLGQTGKSSEGSVTTINCEIYSNHALDGGGIYTDYAPVTIKKGTKIYSHTIKGQGAGVCMNNDADYVQTGGSIYDNKSTESKGGGVCVLNGTAKITGGSINGNEAASDGGGIYLKKGSLDLGVTTNINLTANPQLAAEEPVYVHSNVSTKSGGAFYINEGNLNVNGGDIQDNIATEGKGGVFYINNGTVNLSHATARNNTSGSDGGVLYVKTGSVQVTDDFTFDNNTSTNGNGGAFCVTGGDVAVTNSLIRNNHAPKGYGGGLYVSGGTLTFNGNFSTNNAVNGGAVYLASGAKMKFNGGIIAGNTANRISGTVSETAYNGNAGYMSPVEGCGGGIYLQHGTGTGEGQTKLEIDLEIPDTSPVQYRPFGLYSNLAESAGDDIVSEGVNTDVILPDVSNMYLYGFEGVDANPNWYEDYFKDDTKYTFGTDKRRSSVDRFKTLMQSSGIEYGYHLISSSDLAGAATKYLCVTLGFEMIDITLSATGLVGNECALFHLIRHTNDGINDEYEIMLPGVDNPSAKVSKTIKRLPWGTYSILADSEWNWAYDEISPMENIRIADKMTHEFIFNMHHRNNSEVPQHSEKSTISLSNQGTGL